MIIMSFTRSHTVFAVTAAAALALSACSSSATSSSSSSSQASSASRMKVMASFYPLQYLTEKIGGDLVEVESLTPPGAEPHDLELSNQKVQQLSQAGAVVYLKGFQSAVDKAIELNAPKTVIDVSPSVDLVDAEKHESELDVAEEAAGHDHEHSEEAHDHDHGSTDPHFWLDPTRMASAATHIGDALAQADPANAETYKKNAASVKSQMEALSKKLVDGTSKCQHKEFVTSHEAFGYLADRTGLTQLGLSGLDPDSTPSPARLKQISDAVKAKGITTIFTEELLSPKVAETLANDLGITTAVLDPIESQADASKDYAAVMDENLSALQKALSCE